MSPLPKTWRALAVVISAAVIAAGVVLFAWPTFTVLALYWLENVIIGGFTLLRILAAGARTERNGQSLGSAVFFTLHYGLFCFVHGALVATLFSDIRSAHDPFDAVLLMIGRIGADRFGMVAILAMLVAGATDAWRARLAMNAGNEKLIKAIMAEPYGRIVVLHLVLMGGGLLMQALHAPSLAALLLVGLKLVYDLQRLRDGYAWSGQGAVAGRRSI
jgi:hypothetical protein